MSAGNNFGAGIMDAVTSSPFRSITDVLTLGTAIGNLSDLAGPSGDVFQVAGVIGAATHGVSALVHGIGAISEYSDAYNPKEAKRLGVTAFGELLTCAGHVSQIAGAGAVGLGLVGFGAAISTFGSFSGK